MEHDTLTTKRHSLAHVLAMAVKERFPDARFGIGPAIENGFYYDIELPVGTTLTSEDLAALTTRMRALVATPLTFTRAEVSADEARALFANNPYKTELINEYAAEGRTLSVYASGDFTDLCEGPHVATTANIDSESFVLTIVAGAYWRGNENNAMLTRVYGLAFETKEALDTHITLTEEAKKRDHRKIGKEMELFMLSPEVGSGLPLWLPNGAIVRTELEAFLREEQRRRGYLPVYTPHIGNLNLYKRSGHYPYYSDSQFPPLTYVDDTGKEEQYLLKPMNCPHHHTMYANAPHSYRELPIRYAEFGTVYRHEQSGELNGLTRARGFTQDDSHIYCRPDQLVDELCNAIDLTRFVFNTLGFDKVQTRLSLHDPENQEKYGGTSDVWEQAEKDVKEAADKMGIEYFIGIGEASFYGPKIDFIVKDALGREWQLGTVQVDYVMPERFDLFYIGQDGAKHRPVIIHRAPFGSMERFMGVLIEHTAGNFPLWLAPEQVRILPIGEGHRAYAETVRIALHNARLRVSVDGDNETLGKRIRNAKTAKIPYTIVIGDAEVANNSVTLESRDKGKVGELKIDELTNRLSEEIKERKQ
ncbi:MAG: threonine--tRNA ligase [Candidatus Yonathbacteria bacterium]|nr:threonine--tRNA ligase [Candidatus Yonathbacteria bacterium]